MRTYRSYMLRRFFFLSMALVVLVAFAVPSVGATSPAAGNPKATITITKIPKYGSGEELQGMVSGVDPTKYQVAVYIKVRGGWWTKPYWAHPATRIYPNGFWICDVTTGGLDATASDYAAFLVPKAYSPPLRHGERGLPPAIKRVALAKAMAHR